MKSSSIGMRLVLCRADRLSMLRVPLSQHGSHFSTVTANRTYTQAILKSVRGVVRLPRVGPTILYNQLSTSTGSPSEAPPSPGLHKTEQSADTVVTNNAVPEPTGQQLRRHFVHAMIPMIGFGFMDNMIMLNVGEHIDATFGVAFGLSTLVAAGFGQMASDTAGVCFGGTVEALAAKLGLPSAGMSAAQLDLRVSRLTTTAGMALGVFMGCALGLCSLFFMDLEATEQAKREKEVDEIFSTVIEAGSIQLDAERTTLFLLNEEKGILWSKVSEGIEIGDIGEHKIELPIGCGLAGWVAKQNTLLNIKDAYQDDRFNQGVDALTGYHTKSVLACPVRECCGTGLQGIGKVVGVIQVINKRAEGGFTYEDEVAIKAIAVHVSVFLRHMSTDNTQNTILVPAKQVTKDAAVTAEPNNTDTDTTKTNRTAST